MDIEELSRTILWSAHEDLLGLWEVLWILADDRWGITEDERDSVARELVLDLVSKGWVQVFVRKTADSPEVAVQTENIEAVLKKPVNWTEPGEYSQEWRIGTTSEGFDAYEASYMASAGKLN